VRSCSSALARSRRRRAERFSGAPARPRSSTGRSSRSPHGGQGRKRQPRARPRQPSRSPTFRLRQADAPPERSKRGSSRACRASWERTRVTSTRGNPFRATGSTLSPQRSSPGRSRAGSAAGWSQRRFTSIRRSTLSPSILRPEGLRPPGLPRKEGGRSDAQPKSRSRSSALVAGFPEETRRAHFGRFCATESTRSPRSRRRAGTRIVTTTPTRPKPAR